MTYEVKREYRCTKCSRLNVTFTQQKPGAWVMDVPKGGLLVEPIDPSKLFYLIRCVGCGNQDMCVLPMPIPRATR